MRQSERAFTLIELLVVISIIAIIVGIILPALAKTKRQARFIICQTNLKAYGQAGRAYLTENDDCFPQLSKTQASVR